MPVRRQKEKCFDVSQEALSAAVQVVLSQVPPYYGTEEIVPLARYSTSIRPSFIMLPTTMKVDLEVTSSGTRIIAKTASQWYIFGDIFDCYNRYLDEFFNAVVAELHTSKIQHGQQVASCNH